MNATQQESIDVICLHCRTLFHPASPWLEQVCSDDCRAARRKAMDSKRWATQKSWDPTNPAIVLPARERSRAWAAKNRSVVNRNPWLQGQPVIGTHLPGVSMTITLDPVPKWPIVLRNTRALHGALTALLGVSHLPRFPLWLLRPTPLSASGWAVHWWHPNGAALANKTIDGRLYDRPTSFRFGPAVRLRAPNIRKRGHRLLQVDTITPVRLVTNDATSSYVRPTRDNVLGTLRGEWLARFGLESLRDDDAIRCELVSIDHEQETTVNLGGKYGTARGMEGSFVVDCNATGHWLLEVGARTGFGARTAFGFGCVRVKEIDR